MFIELAADGDALAALDDVQLEAGLLVDETLAVLASDGSSVWYPPPTSAPSYSPTYAPSAPSYAPTPAPSGPPSAMPTTAKPSATPTTARPSVAPTTSPGPTAAPTVACPLVSNFVPSTDAHCVDTCAAVGTYSSPAISEASTGLVDTLAELYEVVDDVLGVSCDPAASYIGDEPLGTPERLRLLNSKTAGHRDGIS